MDSEELKQDEITSKRSRRAKAINNLPKDENGKIIPGPGRPKGSKSKWKMRDVDLKAAIRYVEHKKGKSFLVHLVEQAYKDKQVLIALARKIAPDLKSTELDLSGSEGLNDLFRTLSEQSSKKRILPSEVDD